MILDWRKSVIKWESCSSGQLRPGFVLVHLGCLILKDYQSMLSKFETIPPLLCGKLGITQNTMIMTLMAWIGLQKYMMVFRHSQRRQLVAGLRSRRRKTGDDRALRRQQVRPQLPGGPPAGRSGRRAGDGALDVPAFHEELRHAQGPLQVDENLVAAAAGSRFFGTARRS